MTDTVRDILLAFVRVHVLHHAVHERVFGLGMKAELERHGYHIGPGTLYPLLKRLEIDGLLKSESEVVDGKVRKYYIATKAGKNALADIQPKIAELVGEALRAPNKMKHTRAVTILAEARSTHLPRVRNVVGPPKRCARIAPAARGAAGIAAGFVGRLADIRDIGCIVLRAIVNSNSRRVRASFC